MHGIRRPHPGYLEDTDIESLAVAHAHTVLNTTGTARARSRSATAHGADSESPGPTASSSSSTSTLASVFRGRDAAAGVTRPKTGCPPHARADVARVVAPDETPIAIDAVDVATQRRDIDSVLKWFNVRGVDVAEGRPPIPPEDQSWNPLRSRERAGTVADLCHHLKYPPANEMHSSAALGMASMTVRTLPGWSEGWRSRTSKSGSWRYAAEALGHVQRALLVVHWIDRVHRPRRRGRRTGRMNFPEADVRDHIKAQILPVPNK